MTMNAFKDDVSVVNAATLNPLLSLQDFTLLYEGTEIDSKTGAGVTENNVADNNFVIRATATGVTSLTRVELELASDGVGEDLVVSLLDTDFAADGSAEGTVLATVTVPKEFIPASAAYFSVIINATGLSAGSDYWVKVTKGGDATNHVHLVGEAAQDASHPCYYRAGTSGAWTANNALHFKIYSGDDGDLIHSIYGTNGHTTLEYSGDDLSKIYCYLPPADGAAGGIRDIQTLTWSGNSLKSGAVT